MKRSIKTKVLFDSVIGVAFVLIAIAVMSNGFLASWLEENFDSSMIEKAHLLITLFEEDETGLEFEFADEFMPEFESQLDAEYFQFWLQSGELFEKSKTLNTSDLVEFNLSWPDLELSDIALLDGRTGRLLKLKFVPQLDDDFRTAARRNSSTVVYLALARERESLDSIIAVIEILIFGAIPLVLLILYFVIRYAVENGLRSIEEMQVEIQTIGVSDLKRPIKIISPASDLEGFAEVINRTLAQLSESFEREQRFSADAAHELRTPITELLNMAEVAKRWPDKVDHAEFYSDVIKSTEKMQLIVESLLVLARYRGPKLDLEKIEYNLSERLEESWKAFSDQANARQLQYEFEGLNGLVINTSPIEFDAILNNIISNAVEYCIAGTVIRFSIHKLNDDYMLTVSNQTQELSQIDVQFLFDSLWRKDSSRSSDQHVGLGLSIAKAYAELLGFELSARLDGKWLSISISKLKLA